MDLNEIIAYIDVIPEFKKVAENAGKNISAKKAEK